jgi:hypothetical protein
LLVTTGAGFTVLTVVPDRSTVTPDRSTAFTVAPDRSTVVPDRSTTFPGRLVVVDIYTIVEYYRLYSLKKENIGVSYVFFFLFIDS